MKHCILRFGEKVIKSGFASQMGIGGDDVPGGKLILTDSRLLLVPRKIKRNLSYLEIPFNRIAKSDGVFCVFCETPNAVEITTIDGERFQFVIKKGQKAVWEQTINTAVMAYFETISEERLLRGNGPPSYSVQAPMSPRVNNSLIWLVVFAPVMGLFFEFGFCLSLLIAMGFCYWDKSILRRRGYDTSGLGYACIIPVYLYRRATLCSTGKSSFMIWCFTIFIGALSAFVPL